MRASTKWAAAALCAAAALSCAALLLRPAEGTTAVVSQNGAVLWEIDLSRVSAPETFRVEGEGGLWNVIEIQPGRIRVESAGCPDQICVRRGWIDSGGTPIVCLPGRLTIQIKGEGDGVDAAAG